ncbi:unnamed protein product, partial [Rotaria sordida]
MLYLTSLLPADIGREIFLLFNEYADQKTNEAKLIIDLDIFDMLLQAQFCRNYLIFIVYFDNGLNQLMECQSYGKQFQLPSDSNLNTMIK